MNTILFILDLVDVVASVYADDNTQLVLNGVQLAIMLVVALLNRKERI